MYSAIVGAAEASDKNAAAYGAGIAVIRVAGYCRVSTDKSDQANSFASQCRYFRQVIAQHDGWKMHEIYADEGITGTSTEKRIRFNQMMDDAYGGKFDLLLTKEVSRFSRNILDTIRYTRELRELGISVVFLTDGIRTTDPDAELRLSIMASIAQEESRKTSVRVKWGQTRQMERGVVFGRSLLGYRVCGGKMTVVPEEADLVRRIFQSYALEGASFREIAQMLERDGICTPQGNAKWNPSYIGKILRNEKYVGDLMQKKSVTMDYLTHRKKRNQGEEDTIFIPEHHTPIISRQLWDAAQKRRTQCHRRGGHSGAARTFLLSGKIRCGICGQYFTSRIRKRKDGTTCRSWRCCGRQFREEMLFVLVRDALQELPIDQVAVSAKLNRILQKAKESTGDTWMNESDMYLLMQELPDDLCADLVEQFVIGDDGRAFLHLREVKEPWIFSLEK